MAKSVKKPVETPPYLKSVRIRDYAPLRDAKVSFKPGLNIIIGGNGVGKTRFLGLVSELVSPYSIPIDGADCELILYASKEVKVLFKSPVPKETKPKRGAKNIPNAAHSMVIEVSDGKSQATSDFLMDALDTLLGGDVYYETVPIWFGTPLNQLPIVSENAEMQFVRTGNLKIKEARTGAVVGHTSRFVEVIRQAIESGLDDLSIVTKRKATEGIAVEKVKEIVEQIVDTQLAQFIPTLATCSPIQSVRRFASWQVYYNQAQEEILLKGLVLEFLVNNQWLPFSALSDGTKRMFYIVSEIESASFFDMNFDAEKMAVELINWSKIIFLEEPELGIHPDQLHKLLSLIREVSREHQVIMTTHSPQVLDMLTEKELDRITICELDPKKGTQFRKLSKTKQEEARTYMREQLHLSDYWRYSFLEEKD